MDIDGSEVDRISGGIDGSEVDRILLDDCRGIKGTEDCRVVVEEDCRIGGLHMNIVLVQLWIDVA